MNTISSCAEIRKKAEWWTHSSAQMEAQQCVNRRTAVLKWTHSSVQTDARQRVNERTAALKWTRSSAQMDASSASLRHWLFLIIFAAGSMNNQTHY